MSESTNRAVPTTTAPATAELDRPSASRGRPPAASKVGAARPPEGASSLQSSDPARVGGYRWVARLGAGETADVFYSVASTGRPVAVSGPTQELWLWQFGAALAWVLATLHARGVVHCDVKPSNLLVRGHHVRVIDFGISRYVAEKRPSHDRSVQCRPGWAAPEQLRVGPPTPAADVFAWGCVLAYLAGGVRPFASRDSQDWPAPAGSSRGSAQVCRASR